MRTLDRQHKDGLALNDASSYAQEMRRLSILHDRASGRKRAMIFRKMTNVMNKGMAILEGLHGRKFKPVSLGLFK